MHETNISTDSLNVNPQEMVPSEHEDDSLTHTFGHQHKVQDSSNLKVYNDKTNQPLGSGNSGQSINSNTSTNPNPNINTNSNSNRVPTEILQDSGERQPQKSSFNSPKLERPNFKVSLDTLPNFQEQTSNNVPKSRQVNLDEPTDQLLMQKVNNLAKQLQLERDKNVKLQSQLKSSTSRSNVDDSTSRMYNVHKEALQRQINELSERLQTQDKDLEYQANKFDHLVND